MPRRTRGSGSTRSKRSRRRSPACVQPGTELQVEAIEVALAPLASARETFDAPIGQLGVLLDRAGLRDLRIYVEIPSRRASDAACWTGAMRALARARLRAKLRCGGIVAQAFPSRRRGCAISSARPRANDVAFQGNGGFAPPGSPRRRRDRRSMHARIPEFAGGRGVCAAGSTANVLAQSSQNKIRARFRFRRDDLCMARSSGRRSSDCGHARRRVLPAMEAAASWNRSTTLPRSV